MVLKASRCEPLVSECKALCAWKEKLDGKKPGAPKANLSCENQGGRFAIDVTACIPAVALAKQGTCSKKDGPNCWGSALYLSGMLTAPLKADDSEIEHWTRSSFCRKLKPGEKGEPGDLISIIGQGGLDPMSPYDGEAHSFIAASRELSFEKAGMDKDGPYQFMKTDEILKKWNVAPECRNRPDLVKFNEDLPFYVEIRRLDAEKAKLLKADNELRNKFFSGPAGINFDAWKKYSQTDPEASGVLRKLAGVEAKLEDLFKIRDHYVSEPSMRPCMRWSVQYRCESAIDWLRSRKMGGMLEIVNQLSAIECQAKDYYFNSTAPLSREQKLAFDASLEALKTIVEQELESMKIAKRAKEAEALQGVLLRISTLKLID